VQYRVLFELNDENCVMASLKNCQISKDSFLSWNIWPQGHLHSQYITVPLLFTEYCIGRMHTEVANNA
jgi:hypothetical protein